MKCMGVVSRSSDGALTEVYLSLASETFTGLGEEDAPTTTATSASLTREMAAVHANVHTFILILPNGALGNDKSHSA
jgi:hypothetical protein